MLQQNTRKNYESLEAWYYSYMLKIFCKKDLVKIKIILTLLKEKYMISRMQWGQFSEMKLWLFNE